MQDPKWFEHNRLFHYTLSVETVASILEFGFLLIPNRRELIKQYLPDDDFSRREPQQYGMVSFSELQLADARTHRERFGDFGIAVSWEWAIRNQVQRVIYVEDGGDVFESFKWLFRFGRQEVDRVSRRPTDQMMLENKALSGGMGAEIYHRMLTLYEYMEPERNSSQVEWRIVERYPFYHNSTDRKTLILEILHNARTLKMGSVRVTPTDIDMIVCPAGDEKRLRAALPTGFGDVPIVSYARLPTLRSLAKVSWQWLLQVRKRRERFIYLPTGPPKGSVLLPKSSDGRAVLLPPMAKLWGISLWPTKIDADVSVTMQYEDAKGELFEMRMPANDARQLLAYLAECHQRNWGA